MGLATYLECRKTWAVMDLRSKQIPKVWVLMENALESALSVASAQVPLPLLTSVEQYVQYTH